MSSFCELIEFILDFFDSFFLMSTISPNNYRFIIYITGALYVFVRTRNYRDISAKRTYN